MMLQLEISLIGTHFENLVEFGDGGEGMRETFGSEEEQSLDENVNFERVITSTGALVVFEGIWQLFEDAEDVFRAASVLDALHQLLRDCGTW